jgi:two-component system response regulator FixJ
MSHQRTVYVIDQDLDTRRALAAHLAGIGAEAWPFAGGGEFLGIIDHLLPACILLDMDMTNPSGLEVMRELGRRQAGWPIVALSAHQQVEVAVEAMKLGAVDYLAKPVGASTLSAALAPAWGALEKSIQTSEARRNAQERVSRLTAREVDVSMALLRGQPNKAVAYDFGISVRTVEMHRAHIMAKLGVKSLAEAAVLATQAGLLVTPARAAPLPEPRRLTNPLPQPYLAARRIPSRSAL